MNRIKRFVKPYVGLRRAIDQTFEQTAPPLHRRLVEVFGNEDADAVPVVVRMLEEALLSASDEQVRFGIAEILKVWGEASHVRLYCQAVEDPSPMVREAA